MSPICSSPLPNTLRPRFHHHNFITSKEKCCRFEKMGCYHLFKLHHQVMQFWGCQLKQIRNELWGKYVLQDMDWLWSYAVTRIGDYVFIPYVSAFLTGLLCFFFFLRKCCFYFTYIRLVILFWDIEEDLLNIWFGASFILRYIVPSAMQDSQSQISLLQYVVCACM